MIEWHSKHAQVNIQMMFNSIDVVEACGGEVKSGEASRNLGIGHVRVQRSIALIAAKHHFSIRRPRCTPALRSQDQPLASDHGDQFIVDIRIPRSSTLSRPHDAILLLHVPRPPSDHQAPIDYGQPTGPHARQTRGQCLDQSRHIGWRSVKRNSVRTFVPKRIACLDKVAGHSIISHCFAAVTKVPEIREVFIVGYYDESVFRDFIKDCSRTHPQISIKYLREYTALGTAGGLYHFRDAILKGRPDRFFVLNADVCCSFPLDQMLQLFEEKDAEAVILGTRVSNDAASNFGCIVSDTHTKRVLHYVEKPESHISNLINCGVYLFSTEAIFPSIKSAMKRRADRPRLLSYPSSDALDISYLPREQDEDGEQTETIRLEQDILSDLADSRAFYVLETKDFWRQIKTAGSAVPANALYLMKTFQFAPDELAKPSANILPPVFIHPSAQVDPSAKLGPNVSIGPRVTIGAGVRIKEAIVLEDAEVRHDACILYAIVGWSSRVGAWARVEGTPTPAREHSTSIVKNGVKVQSITILGKECTVADEVRVQNCVCLPYKELKRVSRIHLATRDQK
nr:putative mannose-1-phosphate guanyltransferase [Quercus suber]